MAFLRRRWVMLTAVIVVLGIPGAWLLARDPGVEDSSIIARVRRGEFKVTVTTSGELRARKFVQITAPANAQQANVYQMKISSIVPEGTVVKEGDVVAELDRSTLATRMTEVHARAARRRRPRSPSRPCSTRRSTSPRRAKTCARMELGARGEEARQGAGGLRGADGPAPGGDRPTRRRSARWRRRSVDYKTKTEQAQAKMREVGADLQRQQNLLTSRAGRHGRLHHARPGARHGDLREGVERQEEGDRLAGGRLGADRRDAARPHPDGVDHLRQRNRRPEDRRRPAGRRSRSTPIRPRSSPARSPASPTSASSGPTRTPRSSR